MLSPWNPKLAGERAESLFLAAAMQRGLTVSKPFGDSAPYDFIVDPAPGRRPLTLWRVQVRSTSVTSFSGSYSVTLGHGKGCQHALMPRDADFLAVLIVPREEWYLVPVKLLDGRRCASFGVVEGKSARRWEPFRSAWHLLKRTRRNLHL